MRDAHLARMANQIAASVPSRTDIPEQVALHLASFWTPSMIESLTQHAEHHPGDIGPDVIAALAVLQAKAVPNG
jgi:hypothetical protein